MGNSLNRQQHYNKIQENFKQIFLKTPNKQELSKKLGPFLNQTVNVQDLVFGILPLDIREIIDKKFEYMEFFVNFLIEFIEDVSKQNKKLTKPEINLINNVLVILSKIMTIFFEDKYKKLGQKIFWDFTDPNYSLQEENIQQKKVVIYKSDIQQINQEREEHKCLGIRLMNSLMSLSFYPEFTITSKYNLQDIQSQNFQSPDLELENLKENLWIWDNRLYEFQNNFNSNNSNQQQQNGNSQQQNTQNTQIQNKNDLSQYYQNRINILTCIQACIGQSLYQPQGKAFYNPWILYILSPKNPYNKLFIYSIFFFSIWYRQKGFIPFQAKITSKEKKLGCQLAEKSAQIFTILLNTRINDNELNQVISEQVEIAQLFDYFQGDDQLDSSRITDFSNIFQNTAFEFVKNLTNQNYLFNILNCMLNILDRPIQDSQSFFPDKNLKMNYKIFENNATYNHLNLDNIYLLLVGVLVNLTQNQSISQISQQELEFSLNVDNLPIVAGNVGDLLVVSISSLILNAYEQNKQPYAFNLMSVLANISPFLQNLTELASDKLIQLLILFTSYQIKPQEQQFELSWKRMWKNYKWKQMISETNMENIESIYKNFSNKIKNDLKIEKIEILDYYHFENQIFQKIENFSDLIVFRQPNIVVEIFANQQFINKFFHFYVWNLFLEKTEYLPYFNLENIKIFTQISSQNNQNQHSQQNSNEGSLSNSHSNMEKSHYSQFTHFHNNQAVQQQQKQMNLQQNQLKNPTNSEKTENLNLSVHQDEEIDIQNQEIKHENGIVMPNLEQKSSSTQQIEDYYRIKKQSIQMQSDEIENEYEKKEEEEEEEQKSKI
ncbi:hypothetical protein PPERSA_04589 [Pseudocohnilembus persalinus]|uniref:Uncharacterized protein n=1 Tax=Pseudocohnilembus persalinus TaxID=266149 RepID=A0A0V0QAN3_PSEPJ|nr:hypothetical protein PPERSA_04589 [Pseudocohnilembus persalinus]|eukprot:KRW99227.1 hypothetical protein PPERSA_04589 [Pseudocohnilembus persalinus]